MSKYKVGDFVNIKGRLTARVKEKYRVDIQDNYIWVNEDCIRGTSKTYEEGLADAWELARKIVLKAEMGGICYDDFKKIFGVDNYVSVLRTMTPQQALAKLEEYEESKAIKVGDVVYTDDEPDSFGVVTWINVNLVYVMWNDGSCGRETEIEELHKTGRTVNIEYLLEQIRGDQ